MEQREPQGRKNSRRRVTSRFLLLALIASTLTITTAEAFHDSRILIGRVQASGGCGFPREERQSEDVTSFNGDIETEAAGSRGRASQGSSVSGGDVFTVRTSGSAEVENTEDALGCPFASADLDTFGTVDDDEFDGELNFRVGGQIKLTADHPGADGEGCFFWSFGPANQRVCMTDAPQTIQVNESGVSDGGSASFSFFTSLSLQGDDVGLSVIEWNLTLQATAPDICPAPEQQDPAPAGFDLEPPTLAADIDSEDGAATAAEECSLATVGFRDPVVGGDGNTTEDDEFATLVVELSEPQVQDVRIGFLARPMEGQEAVPGEDFDAALGSLVLAPGQTSSLVLIPLIDDGDAEPDEAFGVLLFVIAGPAITAHVDEIAQVIVRDDDCAMNMPNAGGPNIDVAVPDNLSGTVCGSIHPDQINGNDTINGNDFFGNPVGNVILGGASDDVLFGGRFDDILAGGAGTDVVIGHDGDDELWASNPANSVIARTSNYITETTDGDSLFGGPGNDTLFGSSGANELYGGPSSDSLYGHGGSDQLFGEQDNDFLYEGPPFAALTSVDINILDGGTGGLVDVDVCFSNVSSDVKENCEI